MGGCCSEVENEPEFRTVEPPAPGPEDLEIRLRLREQRQQTLRALEAPIAVALCAWRDAGWVKDQIEVGVTGLAQCKEARWALHNQLMSAGYRQVRWWADAEHDPDIARAIRAGGGTRPSPPPLSGESFQGGTPRSSGRCGPI